MMSAGSTLMGGELEFSTVPTSRQDWGAHSLSAVSIWDHEGNPPPLPRRGRQLFDEIDRRGKARVCGICAPGNVRTKLGHRLGDGAIRPRSANVTMRLLRSTNDRSTFIFFQRSSSFTQINSGSNPLNDGTKT